MSFKSILDKIGTGVKDVFTFLGSSKAQAFLVAGEGIAETIEPGASGAITLFNNWFAEIMKTQALATAAGAQSGSSSQKAGLVLNAMVPQLVAFLQANGAATASAAATADKVNTLLVQAFNAIGADPVATDGAVPAPVAPAPTPASAAGATV